MKKVGLVGGMSPESTMAYYHDIIYGVQQYVGYDFFPDVAVESINLFKWVELCEKKEYDKLIAYTLKPIQQLAAGGADFAVLTANTAHIIFDEVQKHSPIPLLSIVETTAVEAARRSYRKVGLLGTNFTMKNSFFKQPFYRKKIDVITPSDKDMDFIHKKIYQELVQGVVREETHQKIIAIAEKLVKDKQVQSIILGCTELPMILQDGNISVPCLNTVQIHIHEIIRYMMRE